MNSIPAILEDLIAETLDLAYIDKDDELQLSIPNILQLREKYRIRIKEYMLDGINIGGATVGGEA